MEVEDTLQNNLEYSNNYQANSSSQSNTIENQISNKKKSNGKNQGKKRKQSYQNDDEEFTLDQQQRKKINLKSGDNHILKRYNFRHKNKNKNMRIYGYIGCANLGSTCYFNCIIQSLFHISKFRKFIYDQKVDEEVVRITQNQGNEKFKKTFQDCFIQLTYNNTLVNPIELFEQIKYNDETIYEQNDVQEIFQRILNKLQEVISGQKNLKNQINEMFFGEEVYTRKKYGIQDPHPQTLIQNITDISLDVFSSKNLNDAFQFYCNEEIIDKYDHPQHGECQAVKSVKFRKLPNILIISLKRNEYSKNKNQKLHDKFEYQQTLNVKEYMEKQDDMECYEYSLFSVFVHISRQANRGHYYCYISPDGKGESWYEFNDEHISLVENISEVFDDNFQGIKPHYKTASQLIYLKKDKIQNLIFPIKQEDIPLNLIPEEILQNGQIQNQDNQLYGKLIEKEDLEAYEKIPQENVNERMMFIKQQQMKLFENQQSKVQNVENGEKQQNNEKANNLQNNYIDSKSIPKKEEQIEASQLETNLNNNQQQIKFEIQKEIEKCLNNYPNEIQFQLMQQKSTVSKLIFQKKYQQSVQEKQKKDPTKFYNITISSPICFKLIPNINQKNVYKNNQQFFFNLILKKLFSQVNLFVQHLVQYFKKPIDQISFWVVNKNNFLKMQNITSEIFEACSQINNIPSIGNFVSESQILLIVPTNKDFIITINHFDLNHIQQNNIQQQQFSQIQNGHEDVIQNQKDSWFQEATIENDKYMKQYYDKLSIQQIQKQIQRFLNKNFMQNNLLCVILYHFGDVKDQQYKILDYVYVNKEKCLNDVKSLVLDCQKFLSLYPERENSLKVLEQNQEQMEKLEFKQINMNEQIKNIISEKQQYLVIKLEK